MSEWKTVRVADTAVRKGLVGGPFGSSLGTKDYVQSGIPVIRGVNLGSDGKFDTSEFVYVTADKAERELSRNLARPGDVVFTQRGTLGQVGIIPKSPFDQYVISQSQMALRVDLKIAIPDFIYYQFKSPSLMKAIYNHAITTGVPHINLTILGDLKLSLPGLPRQRAIVEVLGALDDKIAVNGQIAKSALSLADLTFRSLVADAEDGAETFGSVALVFGGGTPRTSESSYWDGGIAWTTPSDVTALQAPYLFGTERTITEAGLANCASQLYPPGSIFMTSRATIGTFAVPQLPAAVNQGFIVVVPPRPELRWWLFHEMRSRVNEMLSLANGSTFLELSRTNFKQMPVRLASADVIAQFHERVDSLHSKAAASEKESSTLRELRDTLLSGLMSGRIRVREAEKIVEGAT